MSRSQSSGSSSESDYSSSSDNENKKSKSSKKIIITKTDNRKKISPRLHRKSSSSEIDSDGESVKINK